MSTPLFMLEDLRKARYYLRRYAGDSKCPGRLGYHNAMSGQIAETEEDPTKDWTGSRPPEVDTADPRWPARCECGYEFAEVDNRQVFAHGVYRRQDTGEIMTWEDAPGGAVRDATWWPDKGQDGHGWVIKLPTGEEWMTEGKAGNCQCPPSPEHRCWSRSGPVLKLTVSPSIATPKWHGWLRDGVLTSC